MPSSIMLSHNMRKLFMNHFIKLKCKHWRHFSNKSSQDIRKEFISFFVNENDHKFIRSSPVVPFCDPTVAFVNAGMNQFKGVFLGQFSPPYPRVANSQKCIRVGGKHNDLQIVGSDGYHHTFFEMLGNWSFGDYQKKEACEMAWALLTGPFGLEKDRLVVTYFGGDESQGLEPDLECQHIWRSIGVKDDHIIAGSSKDNFWEMGSTGPCGPCTELHYRGDDNFLMEIWNIVFIQYNRLPTGVIVPLPKCHIDTGMGLERMAAILQNKTSNYDTDLFEPLIKRIQQKSNAPVYGGSFGDCSLDSTYRTLADHSRMISICLADGIFPCRNLKLRTILRKAITTSNEVFKCPSGMLSALYDCVATSLGEAYPELYTKMNEAKQIITHEEETVHSLDKIVKKQRKELMEKYPETIHLPNDGTPGLWEGYKQFKEMAKTINNNVMPGSFAFKLFDTFGLDNQTIVKIAEINKMTVDMDSFREHLTDLKSRQKAVFTETANTKINTVLNEKVNVLVESGILATDDKFKYIYKHTDEGEYNFPHLTANLVAILTENGDIVKEVDINSDMEYHLIFNKTNFYCEEGGQARDVGCINFANGEVFNVKSVSKICELVLHTGKFSKSKNNAGNRFKVDDSVEMMINHKKRLSMMQNHTATHLLNAAVKKVLPQSVTCQLGSKVTANGLSLDLAIYGPKLSYKTINDIQELVRMACSKPVELKTSIINSQELLTIQNVTTVPGEIYPECNLRLVEIDLLGTDVFSRELCCGTHVESTHHIGEFCITSVKGAGGHAPAIRALAGKPASEVFKLVREASELKNELEYNEVMDHGQMYERVRAIRSRLNELCQGDGAPYGAKAECLEILSSVEKHMKDKDTKTYKELVEAEMATVVLEGMENNKPFLVHFVICSYLLEPSNLSLTKAAQCVSGKPAMVLGCANGIVKATCIVPKECVSEVFSAEKWMKSVVPAFETELLAPEKNQNLNIIAHMKGKKVSLINCESLVADAIERATEFGNKFLDKNTIENNPQNDGSWMQDVMKKDFN